MVIIERLKLELSNKEYFTDEEYIVFLEENNLQNSEEYIKATMQRDLLYTVIDILEALSNDVDLMRKIDNPELINIDSCIKYLKQRINDIKIRISTIPVPTDQYANSNISMLFTKSRR